MRQLNAPKADLQDKQKHIKYEKKKKTSMQWFLF